jgi:hypothetical protein
MKRQTLLILAEIKTTGSAARVRRSASLLVRDHRCSRTSTAAAENETWLTRPSRVLDVHKSSARHRHRIRPGAEGSVAFGLPDASEMACRVTDRAIIVGGLTLDRRVGVSVRADGSIGVGGQIPEIVRERQSRQSLSPIVSTNSSHRARLTSRARLTENAVPAARPGRRASSTGSASCSSRVL